MTCGLGQAEHDGEGRVVTAEFEDCYVVNVYTPNSGDGLKRLDYRVGAWDKGRGRWGPEGGQVRWGPAATTVAGRTGQV